jgi:hypothetical protein
MKPAKGLSLSCPLLRRGSKTKNGKSRLNLHVIILEGKSIDSSPQEKAKKESSSFEELR